VFPEQQASDQVSRYDEEHVNTDKAPRKDGGCRVVHNDGQHGDGPKTINVRAPTDLRLRHLHRSLASRTLSSTNRVRPSVAAPLSGSRSGAVTPSGTKVLNGPDPDDPTGSNSGDDG
jgi:hypothetical protein